MRAQTSSMSNGISGISTTLAPAGDAGVGGDPPAVAAHHLDHHHPVVALGRRVQAVDGVGGDLHGGVEPERHVGADDVVVDRLRHADDRQPLLGVELAGDAQRPVAADHDERRRGRGRTIVRRHLVDAGRRVERAPPLGAEHRAAARQRAAHRLDRSAASCGARARRPRRRGSRRARRRSTRSPLRTTARITAFRPGQSPPPVRMPTRTGRA